MNFIPTSISGAFLIELKLIHDQRGFFTRYFCKEEFQVIGHHKEWVQFNHSFTAAPGTVRGMHYQIEPYAESKLIRCVSGKIFDVMVDLRKGSKTFLKWESIELSRSNNLMLFIPPGVAHGFQTLEDNCDLLYHHDEYYHPEAEAGILYNDPVINIDWPLPIKMISTRDSMHPTITNQFKGL